MIQWYHVFKHDQSKFVCKFYWSGISTGKRVIQLSYGGQKKFLDSKNILNLKKIFNTSMMLTELDYFAYIKNQLPVKYL